MFLINGNATGQAAKPTSEQDILEHWRKLFYHSGATCASTDAFRSLNKTLY